ncbi:glutamyl-tRNA amidotransferase [Crepidotus variabilis]|uniref:Glutamyl-tRNA(Gln) amidotransferase subunit B, mitochondrial n=1 Tax=Crepidotus variabilis TaxID=179855 RepID=A0A9P6ER84_9AGAR|nr:glutamyl-tRNA amidotransferase [Crepidotus variabilis]
MFLRRLRPPHCSVRAFHDVRSYKEDTRWPGWQVIVGIETHAQLKSRRKLFSESLTSSLADKINSNVSPFDAAFPGTLPKVNSKCVDLALRTALALKCQVASRSLFDRKHYFYSDLASGYQITQQYAPLAKNGELELEIPNLPPIKVRIKQIQLEQDTAKSTFNSRTQTSNIDLNRAGTGLMEIVSEPDLRSPEEAGIYVRSLQAILRAMGTSDGNMEQGSLRCDVNVSVNKKGEPPGTRCEIKNLNSVKFMMAAITHEVHRQQDFLQTNPGLSVPQETRGFNENTFETFHLRSKEDAPDYRYMPDPNLGALVVSQSRIQDIRDTLPLLPAQRRAYLLRKYPALQMKEQSLDVLLKVDNTRDIGFDGEDARGAVEYFEVLCQGQDIPSRRDVHANTRDPVFVLNWLTHDLLGQLAAHGQTFSSNPLTPYQFGEILDLVKDRQITGTSAKYLLRYMLANPSGDNAIDTATKLDFINPVSVSSSSLSSTSTLPSSSSHEVPSDLALEDPSTQNTSSSVINSSFTSSSAPRTSNVPPEVQAFCHQAISELPNEVEVLRTGKSKGVLNKIVGFVMKKSRGRADAIAVKGVLEKLIYDSVRDDQ